MKPFARTDRVSGQIQKNLSDILRKNISDPRLAPVTITGVKMSKDLRLAYIYFSVSGEVVDSKRKQMAQEAEKGFESAFGYIKRTLAGQLGLRYMPDLRFHYDQSFDYGDRIELVLKNIKTKNGSDSKSS